jgi:hypothetical protein
MSVPADKALTVRLADAIMDSYGDASAEQLAAVLLPVVREYGDQRAAEELEALAREALAATPGAQRVHIPVSAMFDRAAALRGEAGRET